jgi:two-component system response regulator (stage 0 sporulation protein A)
MSEIKLLIVDDNVALRSIIAEYFSNEKNSKDIEVVGVASNGREALDILQRTAVDVVLLDIIMPKNDGFSTMEEISQLNLEKPPSIIVLSALAQEDIIRKACECGAKYYMVKPFDLEVLHKRVIDIGGSQYQRYPIVAKKASPELHSIDERITSVFLMIGIPAHIKGYQYLREAIRMVMENNDVINRITKELYPGIAKRFDTTPSKVERAIRHAIEVAWTRGKIENINQIFGYNIYNKNDKPTNGEFIALIADRLSLDAA